MYYSNTAEAKRILAELDTFIYLRDNDLTVYPLLFSGEKVLETRPRDVFKSITGKGRVGIILLIGKKKFFVGDMVLIKCREWISEEEFDADYDLHLIGRNSMWHKSSGVGYNFADPRWCIPIQYEKPKTAVGNRSFFRLRKDGD